MQEPNIKNWIDQLEVTGPIKGIMDFVDELARNYDRRLAALHIDYQNDVEELLACYKKEKAEFDLQLEEQTELVNTLQAELKSIRQSYNVLNVEHKLNKESLATAQQQLAELTKALKHEEELVTLTKEKIRVANASLKIEMENRDIMPHTETSAELTVVTTYVEGAEKAEDLPTAPVVKPKKIRFKRTREILQQILADRLSRRIVLRPKKQAPIIPDQIQDQDEYSF